MMTISFSFRRQLRSKSHTVWMCFSMLIVLILPFILAGGLYHKSSMLLHEYSLWELISSEEWRPLSGKFGFASFIISSIWLSLLSLLIAAPICLLTAIFLTHFARKGVLKFMHPVIDILAGLPSVIYGVWGILVIVPLISNYIGPFFGKNITGYCILAGAIVLAVMIIPFILNILIEVIRTVPEELAEASLSLGAGKWQTIKKVVIRKAMPGIISAFSLGLSRAFGETMAVLMVVGNVSKMPTGVLQAGYPLPALIANNYGEMLSIPMYDSALMLAALFLFAVVLIFNLLSRLTIVRMEKRM